MNSSDITESISCERWPFVSVIVPVYNGAQRIQTCIEALLAQTYSRARYEVLIVDNGSTDTTRDVVQRYPVALLIEDQIQSSYAARNKGLQQARGEVIAFTDSDCTPVPGWIEEGMRALQSQSADLVGGRVHFIYSLHETGAEIWDSLTNMQIEQNILERGAAKTANLFVRAAVVGEIGPFPDNWQSGGDVIWTKRATRNGFKLVYAPAAEVAHPARRLDALLRKQYRVGKGQVKIWRVDDLPCQRIAYRIVRCFLPPSPLRVKSLLQDSGLSGWHQTWSVWTAAWLVSIATGLGNMVASLGLLRRWS